MRLLGTVRPWAAGLLMIASLILLLFSSAPLPQQVHSILLSTEPLASSAGPATPPAQMTGLSKPLRLSMSWPQLLRLGDTGQVTLALDVAGEAATAPQPDEAVEAAGLFDTQSVVAEARLDLAGMQVEPFPTISEPMAPQRDLQLFWKIHPTVTGAYRGTLWLYLNLVPKGGGTVERKALVARPIEIQVLSVLGLPAAVVRWGSVVGIGLLAWLGMPLWTRLLRLFAKGAIRQK
jgi:hypothetical protein